MYPSVWKTCLTPKQLNTSFPFLLPSSSYFFFLLSGLSLLAGEECRTAFSCWVNFHDGNLPRYFSIRRISSDMRVLGWATPQMSEYLKFFLSTVMYNLKNQQHRSWFCSPLRRIGSQQMP